MKNWAVYIKKRVHFYLGSQHLPEEKIYGTSIGQKWRMVYWFTYILSDKDTLYKVLQSFLWKTGSSHPQFLRWIAVLKVTEDFQRKP